MAKNNNKRRVAEIGAGAAAAALVAVAAAYWLSGKEGKAHRAKLKAWARKAQAEVAKRTKTARKLGEAEYKRIVDQAVKKYGSLEDISAKDIVAAGKQLKSEWARIKSHAQEMAKQMETAKKPAKRHAKRPAKKQGKKRGART